MSQTELKKHHKPSTKEEEASSLKGTLVFVLFLGGFILVSWFAIFYIFLARA
ncbi:cytochrome c oxidase subunit 2A [Salipaludibacillus sp. HK11]|uniref:cytochrome c oxidase subunit 2A n=1 Tax=Salipaludibacillus sp. HK11 TaxID=3394320 RepID=UPI0039FCEE23